MEYIINGSTIGCDTRSQSYPIRLTHKVKSADPKNGISDLGRHSGVLSGAAKKGDQVDKRN
jgi:hypothetical protein